MAAVNVDPGEMVNPQTSPVTVVQIDTTKVKVNVSENVVDSIKPGSKVPVTINALNKTVNGSTFSVEPKADPSTPALAVEMKLPNKMDPLESCMVTYVRCVT